MKRSLKKGMLFLTSMMVSGIFTVSIMAADFPTKPVTLIVPWAAGGGTNVCLRVLAETTSKY